MISSIAVQCLSHTKWDNYTLTFHAVPLDESITHNIPQWNKSPMTYSHRKASGVNIYKKRRPAVFVLPTGLKHFQRIAKQIFIVIFIKESPPLNGLSSQ